MTFPAFWIKNDENYSTFYTKLLQSLRTKVFRSGKGQQLYEEKLKKILILKQKRTGSL